MHACKLHTFLPLQINVLNFLGLSGKRHHKDVDKCRKKLFVERSRQSRVARVCQSQEVFTGQSTVFSQAVETEIIIRDAQVCQSQEVFTGQSTELSRAVKTEILIRDAQVCEPQEVFTGQSTELSQAVETETSCVARVCQSQEVFTGQSTELSQNHFIEASLKHSSIFIFISQLKILVKGVISNY
jgi:hypothetical protein